MPDRRAATGYLLVGAYPPSAVVAHGRRGDRMPNKLKLQLPPKAASAREARRQVRAMVTSWSTECAAALQLLVDELVTNAVLHARSDTELVAIVNGTFARVEVRDRSTRLPTPLHYGPSSVTGRGLHLVEALAQRWGVDEVTGGKIVWFEFDCSGDDQA
jgi:anti-sigma regulatory factor (Ser/Thr protein kinase)